MVFRGPVSALGAYDCLEPCWGQAQGRVECEGQGRVEHGIKIPDPTLDLELNDPEREMAQRPRFLQRTDWVD